jgi:hypothetical protein
MTPSLNRSLAAVHEAMWLGAPNERCHEDVRTESFDEPALERARRRAAARHALRHARVPREPRKRLRFQVDAPIFVLRRSRDTLEHSRAILHGQPHARLRAHRIGERARQGVERRRGARLAHHRDDDAEQQLPVALRLDDRRDVPEHAHDEPFAAEDDGLR